MPRTRVTVKQVSAGVPSITTQVPGVAAAAGVGSFGTAASSRRIPVGVASPISTNNLATLPSGNPPVWSTVPTITFIQGTPGNKDISQYDSKGATDTITHTAGVLPTGVTYNQVLKRYEYDGAGGVAGTNGHILTADDSNLNADWTAMTAGAVMATRFDTAGEVLDYRWLNGDQANITHDTARKWHAVGSAKFAIPDTSTQQPGEYFRHLDDSFGLYTGSGGQLGGQPNGTNQGFDPPMSFEVAHALYIPASLRDNAFPNGNGWKFGMTSWDGRSNNSFEIVWQNDGQRGYPQGYHRNPPNTTHWDVALNDGATGVSPDFWHQNQINHGANALVNKAPVNPDNSAQWTPDQKLWGQYGGLWSYEVNNHPNKIGNGNVWKYWEQVDPTGASIGPILFPQDDWIALKIRVDLNSYSAATNRIRWYVMRRWHTSWQLVADQQNCLLPTEIDDYTSTYNKRYNAFHMTFFHTNRTGGGGVNTFGNLGWVICRRDGGVIPPPQVWPAPG